MAYGTILGQRPSTTATNVSYNNSQTSSIITSNNVQGAIDQLFTSVSNGKTLIANAITDKGVPTSSNDTFATMASNISLINPSFTIDNVYNVNFTLSNFLTLPVGQSYHLLSTSIPQNELTNYTLLFTKYGRIPWDPNNTLNAPLYISTSDLGSATIVNLNLRVNQNYLNEEHIIYKINVN